jgi:hypothetical protein
VIVFSCPVYLAGEFDEQANTEYASRATFQICFPPLTQRGIRTAFLLSAEGINEHGTQFILFCGGFWYHGSSE